MAVCAILNLKSNAVCPDEYAKKVSCPNSTSRDIVMDCSKISNKVSKCASYGQFSFNVNKYECAKLPKNNSECEPQTNGMQQAIKVDCYTVEICINDPLLMFCVADVPLTTQEIIYKTVQPTPMCPGG